VSQQRAIEIGRLGDESVLLTPQQRRTHLHIIGPSESGKTRVLEHLIHQDILAGHGVCVLDPTGGLYKRLVQWCAARGLHRRRQLHFFDPNSDDQVIGFNPLELRPGEDVAKRVDSMVLACARVWSEDPSSTPLLKRILRAVFTALIEHGQTLVEGIELVMPAATDSDKQLRSFLTSIENPYARRVWGQLNALKTERFEELASSTNNRMADFLMSERMCRIFGYGAGSLDLRQCMDEGHCVFVNLQPKQISTDNSRLLGTLITNELLQLARSRDNAIAVKFPFYAYLDEAYRFLTDDIEQAIDETRQKGLHYILAHQRLSQLSQMGPNIYGGVMSIRNKVVFGDLPNDETHTLANELFQAEYDENAEVEALRKPVTVRHEIRRNLQHRDTHSMGVSDTSAEAEVRSVNQGDSSLFSLPTDQFGVLAGDLVNASNASSGQGRAVSQAQSQGMNESRGRTDGWAEGAWPVLEERAGGLRSYDEQMHIYARKLRTLPQRTILMKLRGTVPVQIKTAYVGDPITRESRLTPFLEAAAERSSFTVSVNDAEQQLQTRRQELERAAKTEVVDEAPDHPTGFFQ